MYNFSRSYYKQYSQSKIDIQYRQSKYYLYKYISFKMKNHKREFRNEFRVTNILRSQIFNRLSKVFRFHVIFRLRVE